MSDAIQGLLQLQERWPDFFEFIRSLNGFETALSEERIAEISQQIDADTDGMRILGDCMAMLTDPDRSTPDERDWLRKNGFIHKKMVDYGNRLAELEEQLEHEWMSEKEKAAIREEVIEIMADIRMMSQDSQEARKDAVHMLEDPDLH